MYLGEDPLAPEPDDGASAEAQAGPVREDAAGVRPTAHSPPSGEANAQPAQLPLANGHHSGAEAMASDSDDEPSAAPEQDAAARAEADSGPRNGKRRKSDGPSGPAKVAIATSTAPTSKRMRRPATEGDSDGLVDAGGAADVDGEAPLVTPGAAARNRELQQPGDEEEQTVASTASKKRKGERKAVGSKSVPPKLRAMIGSPAEKGKAAATASKVQARKSRTRAKA